jgi:hypothetical protein
VYQYPYDKFCTLSQLLAVLDYEDYAGSSLMNAWLGEAYQTDNDSSDKDPRKYVYYRNASFLK